MKKKTMEMMIMTTIEEIDLRFGSFIFECIYKRMGIDKLYLSVTLFVCLYMMITIVKPDIIYNHKKNALRPFGVGYKNTTIVTLWLASILLAILSYFFVIYVYFLYDKWF